MATTTTKTNKPILPRGVDNRPVDSYNRAELYSGKALDFDGVNDKVEVADNANLSFGDGTTDSPFSITGYFNLDTLFAGQTIAAKDNITNREYSLFVTANNQLRFFIKNNGGGNQQSIDSDLVLESGKWYFASATYDGRGGDTAYQGLNIYVNGQLTGVDSFFNNSYTAMTNTTAPFTAGVYGSAWMNGQLSNIKVFAGELTAAQVADLYNNPEKVVPTGVADSALKLWLPMQEGAGTTALNGAPDALGSEEVTNGDFDTDSDWNKAAGWTISGGKANANTTGSYINLYQNGVFTIGKTYKVSFDITDYTSGDVRITEAGYDISDLKNAVGSYSFVFTASYSSLYIQGLNSFVGSIDNVSVKEIQNVGTISGATWTHGVGAPVAQTSVIDWNKVTLDLTNEVLVPQGLTSGRDLLGNLFENVRKQGALNLDGNSWAAVHDNASLDITGEVTIEFWCKIPQIETNIPHIIGKRDSIDSNWLRLYKNSSGTMLLEGNGGISIGTPTPDETWTHFVATIDGTSGIIYKNGVSSISGYVPFTMVDSAPLSIGAWIYQNGTLVTPTSLTNGQLAQPRIYNRALTAEEVKRNYEVSARDILGEKLLLNEYSGAAAAYSLRRLDRAYQGDAIVVRRASDNATKSIGFVNNELDTTSLESFCSGTDGFVTTWYDQSGNGLNATQTTSSAQPKIVSSGSTILENGKPIIDGKDAGLDIGLSGNSNTWIFTTIKSTTDGLSILYSSGGASPYCAYARTGTSSISSSLSNESYYINGTYYSPANITREDLFNLTQSQALFVGNANDSGVSSSRFGYNFSSIDMYQMKEFILYDSDQSTNRSGIETNINDFYSIY